MPLLSTDRCSIAEFGLRDAVLPRHHPLSVYEDLGPALFHSLCYICPRSKRVKTNPATGQHSLLWVRVEKDARQERPWLYWTSTNLLIQFPGFYQEDSIGFESPFQSSPTLQQGLFPELQ